jgi:integrase
LSLKTSSADRARSLAVQLDAAFEEIVMLTTNASLLNAGQLDVIMRGVIAEHAAKLDRIAAIEKLAPDFDVAEAVRLDVRMGWAFRLFDAQGVNASVRDEDRQVMTAAGLDASDIATVERHLGDLRRQRMVPTPRQRLERLVTSQAALPSEMNLASAQQVYFRALSLALFETDRRYAGVVPDAAEIVAAALRVDRSGAANAASMPATMAPVQPAAIMTADEPPVATIKVPDGIIAIGEKLIAVRAKDENWDEKTQRQARQIYELVRRCMVEEYEFDGLTSLSQTHLASFVTFLQTEIYKHHGKSERDHSRTIEELRKIAASKPKQLQGLEGETLNRHLGNLSQLVQYARAQGIRIDPEIDITALRSRKNKGGRARDKRAKMPANVMTRVFHAAPFVGCAAWDRPYEFKEGGLVFHRASYYGPMLLNYTGGRREEICGLCIDDVVTDGPIPYIHIAQNEFRRIKNPQSIRDIPLHPELLRLWFPEYVDLIRSLGYRRVFPDLYSPTSKSPLGDRFYDEFMPVLAWACKIEGVDLEFVLHSIRHGFNSRLKARNVSVEDRADLMGHGGDSETSERYADPILLQKALDVIRQLPSVTDHLQPYPIQLLPWVQNREDAPFSRGRDRKRRA